MNKHTDTELHTIKTQLKDIRSAMNVSGSTFSLIYSANNFRRMFILSGIFSLLFPLLYQVLLWAYLTPAEIPLLLRIVFYACIFICWCILLVVRTKASIRMAKAMGLPSSVWELVKQLLATRMWLAIVPAILLLIALPIKYAQAFEPLDYVPYFGIVLGLMLNMIGVMIRETEYSVCGAWMILSGAAGLFIVSISVHIAFAVILAPACFLFVITNNILRKTGERSDEAV